MMIKAKTTAKSGKASAAKQQPAGRGAKRTTTNSAATAAKEAPTGTKTALLTAKLGTASGASLAEIATATGWQHHSIRGAISGHLKKKLGLKVISAKDASGVRRYRIAG